MTERADNLAQVIRAVTDLWDEPLDEVHDVPQIVNAVLAAGWVPGAGIEALAETRAIVVGSRQPGEQGSAFWEWTSGLIDGLDLAGLVLSRGEAVDPHGLTFPLTQDEKGGPDA